MKPFVRFLVLAVTLLFCNAVVAGEETEELSKTTAFAFGGVGFAGTTSPGELAFRKVMGGEEPRAQFLRLVRSGTAPAKCYALVGLKLLDPQAFEEEAKRFMNSTESVQTIGGCIVMNQALNAVVEGIRRGNYDLQAKTPRDAPKR